MTTVTLVTGGAGFVGKPLVAKLRARGERVRSFDLAAAGHPDDVTGSVTDREAVARALDGVGAVYHLAGNAQLWSRDPGAFDAVNRGGAENVLDAAIKAGVRRFVHCSSLTTLVGRSTRIGNSTADEATLIDEEDLLGAYPLSKWRADRLVEQAARDGLSASIGIPTEPLGPGDVSITPPTRMILDFANGDTPAYIDCVLNFVPVDDLADGFIAIHDRGRAGERYLLGGENVAMRDLLAMIEAATGRPTPKTRMPYWVALAAGAVETGAVSALTGKPPKAPLTGVRLAGRQVSFSSEKAARELGWRAGDARTALSAMLDWAAAEGLLKPV